MQQTNWVFLIKKKVGEQENSNIKITHTEAERQHFNDSSHSSVLICPPAPELYQVIS